MLAEPFLTGRAQCVIGPAGKDVLERSGLYPDNKKMDQDKQDRKKNSRRPSDRLRIAVLAGLAVIILLYIAEILDAFGIVD